MGELNVQSPRGRPVAARGPSCGDSHGPRGRPAVTRGPSCGDVDKTPSRIAGMFDAIAPRYDLLNHLLSAGLDTRWRARAVRELSLRGTERVLDICTGTGDLAVALLKDGAAREVIG